MNLKMLNFYINVYVNKIVYVISDTLYANKTMTSEAAADELNLMELGYMNGPKYCLEADIENNIIPARKNRFS